MHYGRERDIYAIDVCIKTQHKKNKLQKRSTYESADKTSFIKSVFMRKTKGEEVARNVAQAYKKHVRKTLIM